MKTPSNNAKFKLWAALTLLTISACHAQEKFKVCADPLNPPYSSQDQSGYENKIAALFAKELGYELEYSWFPDRMGFIRNTLKAENENGQGYKCDIIMSLPQGSDLADTTHAYLHSTYVLLIKKGRGWDDITDPDQLPALPLEKQEKLKIAMFDRDNPGTTWLEKHGLLEQGVPYQSMTGDKQHNTAMQIETDLSKGTIDMAILWSPMAGYVQSKHPHGYIALPMKSQAGIRFDFSIAMAVRQSDKEGKQRLNDLIEKNQEKINNIMESYQIIMLPIESQKDQKKEND